MLTEDREKLYKIANELNPFSKSNGIFLTEVTDEYAIVEHEIGPESLNLHGAVHGGLVATMVDFTGGAVARIDGRKYVTSSMEVKFIGNVFSGKLSARGEVISRGRSLCNILVRVTADNGEKLIAEGMCTYFCIDR